jgi:tRNA pseudouridine55 synthase
LISGLVHLNSTLNQQSSISLEQLMDGVLIIDKPAGPTSHDVVARMRRVLGTKRIGHTGTLDPFATGVLPLVIGRATRLASFLSSDEKEYEAGIRFGLATETYDGTRLTGENIETPPLAMQDIEDAVGAFRGTFEQTPPPFSAKKIDGVPAYKLARKSKPVVLRPVRVTVKELVLLSYAHGLARVRLQATAGFYVRSLAHDVGLRLGCGAHLEYLRRTRAGGFDLAVAIPLDAAEADVERARASLVPLEQLLPALPMVTLNDRGVWRATHGNDIEPSHMADSPERFEGRVRLVDAEGKLLGLAESRAGGTLRPIIVLV